VLFFCDYLVQREADEQLKLMGSPDKQSRSGWCDHGSHFIARTLEHQTWTRALGSGQPLFSGVSIAVGESTLLTKFLNPRLSEVNTPIPLESPLDNISDEQVSWPRYLKTAADLQSLSSIDCTGLIR
jgi:hypothetical protein